jgi:hypothetical protein
MTEVKRYTFDARAGTLTRYEDGTLIVRANSELVPADDYDMLVVQFNELVAQADKYIVAGQDDKARIAQLEALVRRFVAFDPYPDSTLTKDARSALAPKEPT